MGLEIYSGSIETFLSGLEPVPEDVLEVFLELLCGRFQGVLPNICPTSKFRMAGSAFDDGFICEIRFSDECLTAALAAAKFYRNWNLFVHRAVLVEARIGSQLYPQTPNSSFSDQA
jgi:hypothetical protein